MWIQCTVILASISNTEWAPGTQPPGYLSQMLLLEVPDALPACQTMLITCYGGFYYAWGWCAGTVHLFANICPIHRSPSAQKTAWAAVPCPQAFSKGTLSLEIVMASFLVCCVVFLCGGWLVELRQRREYWASLKEGCRLLQGCSFQGFWWYGLVYPDSTQPSRLDSEQLQLFLLAGYNLSCSYRTRRLLTW